jgi:hypothetical protein
LGVVSGLLAITRTLGQTVGIAIIGALWTSLVLSQTGLIFGGATQAPAKAQVFGLHTVFIILGFILVAGMFLSIYAWIQERHIVKVVYKNEKMIND